MTAPGPLTFKAEGGRIIDSDGISYASVGQAMVSFMGFCGCGDPVAAGNFIGEVLATPHPESRYGLQGASHEQLKTLITENLDAAAFVILYALDQWEFTEHGTSIQHSWLTERGTQASEILRAYRDEDDEDPEPSA